MDDDRKARLAAFWSASQELESRLNASVEAAAERVPAFAALLARMTVAQREEQAERGKELQRRALLEDDWTPYLDDLRAQAQGYALSGVEFADWFELIEVFRRTFVAEMIPDTGRSRAALLGMEHYLDVAVSTLGTAYIDAKEALIRRAEEEIELYRDMFVHATYGKLIYEWTEPRDEGSFRLVAFNPVAVELAGEDLASFSGRRTAECPPPACLGPEATAIFAAELGDGGSEGWSIEHRGRVFDARCFAIAEGRFLGVVLEDNTEQRTLERALERHVADLERSNRELDDFAYVTSHDLKSPLSDVHNLAQWIAEDAAPHLPDGSRRHLQLLQERIQRMDRLLDDLLEYSRVGRTAGDAREFDVHDVFEEIVGLIGSGKGFEIVLESAPLTFHGPRAPFAAVLRNLVSNAIKHHDREAGRITVKVERLGSRAEICVADDGPGIAPQFHGRVFRMFQTLRPRDEVEGSGVGLAIVKKSVEMHGGAVAIESEGRGTTVRFDWPLRWPLDEEGGSR